MSVCLCLGVGMFGTAATSVAAAFVLLLVVAVQVPSAGARREFLARVGGGGAGS